MHPQHSSAICRPAFAALTMCLAGVGSTLAADTASQPPAKTRVIQGTISVPSEAEVVDTNHGNGELTNDGDPPPTPCQQVINTGVGADLTRAKQRTYEPIDISQFRDSIRHWQKKDGRGRNDRRFRANQIVHIAESLLKFQNEDGGWPANLDWLAQIDVAEVRKIRKNTLGRSTFDNRNTYPQIDYLAQVHQVTGLRQFQDAALRGLEYLLQQQRSSGGWCGKDVDAITFNDDVMVGIMNLLLKIRQGGSNYQWLTLAMRARLSQSLDDAIAVTLRSQIHVNGKQTAWCQQHDHTTYDPVRARTYELPSLTAQESVGVVLFFLKLPDPSPEVIAAVDGAMAWFESAKIEGIKIENVPITPIRFDGFTATFDRIVIHDEKAPPTWARFYEIETNRPFFCNRDGKKVYDLSEVELERRVGYGWYGYWPSRLIEERYPVWKSQLAD